MGVAVISTSSTRTGVSIRGSGTSLQQPDSLLVTTLPHSCLARIQECKVRQGNTPSVHPEIERRQTISSISVMDQAGTATSSGIQGALERSTKIRVTSSRLSEGLPDWSSLSPQSENLLEITSTKPKTGGTQGSERCWGAPSINRENK